MPRQRRGISIRRVWTLSTITLLTLTAAVALTLRSQNIAILGALDADADRAAELQHDIEGRMQAMLNQEVGLRGFVATGEDSFLDPYRVGRREELRLRSRSVVDGLAAEDRDELAHALGLEERAATRWHEEIAEPQISWRRLDGEAGARALFEVGKQRFDAYRAAYGTLRQALDRAFVNQERRQRAHLSRAHHVAAALLLGLIVVSALLSRTILRRTIEPLIALCDAAERGEVSVDAVGKSHVREVLVLARTLERLFRGVQDRAMRDGLTRVYNRAYLAELLPRQLRLARRNGAVLSALMVDIDHFKRVNDTRGHAAGDQVLVAVARCIEQQLRGSDVVVRYGGEEFTVILPDTPVAGGFVTAERLRAAIAAMTDRDGLPEGLRITASVGLAALGKGDDGAQLLPRADAALYQAKRGGRNRVVAASMTAAPVLVAVAGGSAEERLAG